MHLHNRRTLLSGRLPVKPFGSVAEVAIALSSQGVKRVLTGENSPELGKTVLPNNSTIRGERRSYLRCRSQPGKRVDLIYQRVDRKATEEGHSQVAAVTSNIGAGGAFVLGNVPEEVGTKLEIFVKIPDSAQELVAIAHVRWVRVDGEASGMGVEFEPLEASAVLLLRSYFSTLGRTC